MHSKHPLPALPLGRSSFGAEQGIALGILVVALLLVAAVRRWHARRHPVYKALQERLCKPQGEDVTSVKTAMHRFRRTHGANILMGADGRLSTSKTIAALWTVVLGYMLITMGLIGANHASPGDAIKAIINPTSQLYLILLGGPFAAAVIAKVTVSDGVATGRIQKPPADSTGPSDVTSNDQGSTDLVDSQYTLFNVIVATIVMVAFVKQPGFGAPAIPAFLVTLTGASAATYVANKAATGNPPSITKVLPGVVRIGQAVTAYGVNLYAAAAADAKTVVTVGGFAADVQVEQPDHITFKVPVPTGGAYPADPVEVVVKTVAGATAVEPGALRVVADAITITRLSRQTAKAGEDLTVYGTGFLNAADVAPEGTATSTASWPTVQLEPAGNGEPVGCPLKDPRPSDEGDAKITFTVPAATAAGGYLVAVGRDGVAIPDDKKPTLHVVA